MPKLQNALIRFLIACLLLSTVCAASNGQTTGFANAFGSAPDDYSVTTDGSVTYSGQASTKITIVRPASKHYGAFNIVVSAAPFRGKRVEVSAFIKTRDAGESNIWVNVVGDFGVVYTGDEMDGREIKGTRDWTKASAVVDVDPRATSITYGAALSGSGTAWIADFTLQPVNEAVQTTGRPMNGHMSEWGIAMPDRDERERLASELRAYASALGETAATSTPADLKPFDDAVAHARIVGLGESSHGASDFFLMKDRLIEDLVLHHGFTVLAMEASTPEAEAINQYIRDGIGNPTAAIKGMHFWTWDTTEVLQLVEWLRQYNVSRGNQPAVSFAGFDMQSPQLSAAKVVASEIGSAKHDLIEQAYTMCLGSDFELRSATIRSLSADDKTRCISKLQNIAGLMATSPDATLAHAAVLVDQAFRMAVAEEPRGRSNVRDRAMAENVAWLANVRYPSQKIVLWAHDWHISRQQSRTMGFFLAKDFGADYEPLGFSFDRGSMRAIDLDRHKAETVAVPKTPDAAMEAVFRLVGPPVFFVDLRRVPKSTEVGRWLHGTAALKMPGAVYDPRKANEYYEPINLAQAFDMLIFIDEVHPSQALR